MLHEEVALYEKLTGEDGWHTPIMKVGSYLDGYEKGLSILEDIKAKIPNMTHWQSPDGQDLVMVADMVELIDEYISGK